MYKIGDRLVTGHRLIKFLGRGNFGEVWQASAPGNTYAALKFLNLDQTQGRREYRAIQPLKNLRHANLLQMTAIYLLDENGEIIPDDVAMDGILVDTVRGTMQSVSVSPNEHRAATLIIAMPFADMSLDKLLSDYKERGEPGIPRDELFDYMEDAAKAIDFLNSPHHDLGQGPMAIRHCDVKPENLLLMGQSVVLCDFGVSRPIIGASTARKTSMGGSLAYMAPECLADEVTEYSDQFSLAISYLELRTGKLPFENLSQAAVMDQRRRGILDLSDLPRAEAAVIRRATSANPSKRFASAMEMVNALRASTVAPPKFGWVKVLVGGLLVVGLLAIALKVMPKKGTEEIATVTPWQDDEKRAYEKLDSDWPEAVESMASSITNRPEAELVWPSFECVHRSLNRKMLTLRRHFWPTQSDFVYAIKKEDDGTFKIGKSRKCDFEPSSLVVDDGRPIGLLGNELIAVDESGDTAIKSTDATWQLSNDVFTPNDSVDLTFADNGSNAALLNWTKSKLVSLGQSKYEISLPDISEKKRKSLLSDDGTWIAIFASPGNLYIGKLDGSYSELVNLPIGQEDDLFFADDELFSFQPGGDKGYVTLGKKQDGDNHLLLVDFSLKDPQKFTVTNLTESLTGGQENLDGWRANYAQLESRGNELMLSIGTESHGALILTDLANFEKRIVVSVEGLVPKGTDASVDRCVTLRGALGDDNLRWMVWSIDTNLYVQPLTYGAVGVKFASSHRNPERMDCTKDTLIVGFDNADFDVYDFKKLRLMYMAALRAGKLPLMLPSSVRQSTT